MPADNSSRGWEIIGRRALGIVLRMLIFYAGLWGGQCPLTIRYGGWEIIGRRAPGMEAADEYFAQWSV